jgi:diguanylate cyclase (GGDEF)-like protein/PAS domain S-box-containing protein
MMPMAHRARVHERDARAVTSRGTDKATTAAISPERTNVVGMKPGQQRTALASLGAIALAVCAGVACTTLGLLAPLDRAILDAQSHWERREVSSDIVIVEIDARSLQELDHWPWPRRYHAAAIDTLLARGASQVFVDIDFSSTSNPADDAALAQAVARGGRRIVLPSFWRPSSAGSAALLQSDPLPMLGEHHVRLGAVNLLPDAAGLVREVRAFTPGTQTAVAPVPYVLAGREPIENEPLLLDYRISPSSFASLSYVDVLRTPDAVPDLRGKIVFIGATSAELNDMIAVPVFDALPGVFVQALALETLIRGSPQEASPLLMCGLIGIWAVFCALLIRSVSWRRATMVALVLGIVATAAAALAYAEANLIVPLSGLWVTLSVVLLSSLLLSLSTESWANWSMLLRFKRQDALLAQIVTHSTDAILTLDPSGKVSTANPACVALFGRSIEELRSCSIDQLLPQGRALLEAREEGRRGAIETTVEAGPDRCIAVEAVIGRIDVGQDRIFTITLRDISAQKDRERELRFHATHDALTGLPNRVFVAERLGEMLDPRAAVPHGALVLMDLDGFKEINDTLGHSVGDTVLVELAQRLLRQVPAGTCVARLGGDEFAVVINLDPNDAELSSRCSELLLVASEPVVVKGIPVPLGISAGVARWPLDADTAETLMQRADVALYCAKRKRTHLEYYDAATDHNSPRRLEMLTLLRQAIANDEMSLHYQPKIALATGSVTAVEALSRWESSVLGKVSPAEFIALAEATDLITPLTHWSLRRALEDCRLWLAQGFALQVAVNLSARHLQDARLPRVVQDLLHSSGVEPHFLELEITESAIMSDPERALRIVLALREIGVAISIDDFGTGYSSLAYLQNLNIDRLKIDRSFVMGMQQSAGSRVIVGSIVKLGHALGLEIVAEGVETDSQRAELRSMGCDYGQGYLFSPALAVAPLLQWCGSRAEVAKRSGTRTPISVAASG